MEVYLSDYGSCRGLVDSRGVNHCFGCIIIFFNFCFVSFLILMFDK